MAFFAHPARIWLVIGSFLLLIAAWFSGSSGISAGEKHSAASKTILYGFGLVLVLLTLVPPYCDRRDIWVIDGDAARYFGLLLFFAGSFLRLAAVRFRPALQRFSRHSTRPPTQDRRLVPLHPAPQLHRTDRIDDWLRAHFPKCDRTALKYSFVPIPGQPNERRRKLPRSPFR
jgi:hypothetical protein